MVLYVAVPREAVGRYLVFSVFHKVFSPDGHVAPVMIKQQLLGRLGWIQREPGVALVIWVAGRDDVPTIVVTVDRLDETSPVRRCAREALRPFKATFAVTLMCATH